MKGTKHIKTSYTGEPRGQPFHQVTTWLQCTDKTIWQRKIKNKTIHKRSTAFKGSARKKQNRAKLVSRYQTHPELNSFLITTYSDIRHNGVNPK